MLSESDLNKYERDGFLVIENFIDVDKCKLLRKEMLKILCDTNDLIVRNEMKLCVFPFLSKHTETKENLKYFMSSADNIKPFLNVKIDNGEDIEDTEETLACVHNVNKIGFALHALNPTFKEVTYSDNVKNLAKSVGFKKPIVCQSMYIFKKSLSDATISSHQVGTFVRTDPFKVAGLWIALKDSTIENGCLMCIPGSHKGSLIKKFIRNPNKEEYDSGKYFSYTSGSVQCKKEDFVSVPVKAGSVILIDGLTIHESSLPTSKTDERHAYLFHIYEGHDTKFLDDNWLKYDPKVFLPLFQQAEREL